MLFVFRWIFLEVLGSLVLLGVIFIDAKSRRMELAMCELTIFSVSMLCYVLADLDSPFNGFFRVDLSVLPDVIKRVEYIFNQAKCAGHSILLPPPTSNSSKEQGLFKRKMRSISQHTEEGVEDVRGEKGQGEGLSTARSLGEVSLAPEEKKRSAPGAHGVMAVTHAGGGRRSAFSTCSSMETQLTDVQ